MRTPVASAAAFPARVESPSGLAVQWNANGSLRRMDCGGITINLFPGNEMEGGPANLYLRRVGPTVECTPLLGPQSPAAVHCDAGGLRAHGEWRGIRFSVRFALSGSAPAWFWHVALQNAGDEPATLDLVHAQDLGLAHYGFVRLNEYYASHYVDHTPLHHPGRGVAVASRQNLAMNGRFPWTVIGALGHGESFCTDALQFYGFAGRAGGAPASLAGRLPGVRRQHEHSMVVIQEQALALAPGAGAHCGFFGWFEADHPAASASADLAIVDRALSLPEAVPGGTDRCDCGNRPAATLFSSAPLLDALELTETEVAQQFGAPLREPERENGRLLSAFAAENRHVVMKAKELKVLRPHVQLLRSGCGFRPEERALTTTSWMAGVFNAMLTQGHVGLNRLLSATRGYLGLFRSHGQRIFVETEDGWQLLDVPSACEMAPDRCLWIYRHGTGQIAVRNAAAADRHALELSVEVLSGPERRFLISHHLAIDGDDDGAAPVNYEVDERGIFIRPSPGSGTGRRFPEGGFRIAARTGTILERVGGDELLFADGRSRQQPFLCIVTAAAHSIGFSLIGCLVDEAPAASVSCDPAGYWRTAAAAIRLLPPAAGPLAAATARLGEILPWFANNALIHFLAPRGPEQFTGGGWGTRDVCQGPIEMLLALGRFEDARELLVRVFEAQDAGGDWPQWFAFFERDRHLRAADAHGDIVFWPLLALARYVEASADASLPDEPVAFFHPQGRARAERASVWQHVERALAVAATRSVPGTSLPAYGQGDWNDAMQPVDPAMRERMCSSWTATLQFQTLHALARALRSLGRNDHATRLLAAAERLRDEFQRLLIADGILAGFARVAETGAIDYLLHPRDRTTGISYSLLPMIHAVSAGLFTMDQAARHLGLIDQHLLGPDGARLFDRPMPYHGGPSRHFLRAESSAFFGREIGLMYTHAHLRYAEALAELGLAGRFFEALCQINPIAIGERLPGAAPRQSNCYYTSSDAAFADRYEASAEYDRAMRGEIPLEGGWRVYSSGPGIALGLILCRFLGFRHGATALEIDPVIPKPLDGLRARFELGGRRHEVSYRIERDGCGPTAVRLNGVDLTFTRLPNPYRPGGVRVEMETVRAHAAAGENHWTVRIG